MWSPEDVLMSAPCTAVPDCGSHSDVHQPQNGYINCVIFAQYDKGRNYNCTHKSG